MTGRPADLKPEWLEPQWRLVERFLLFGDLSPRAVPALHARLLGSYAYTALPETHPLRREFQPDYAAAVFEHLTSRREVHGLLRVWVQGGVQALLFKGFHLSEFVCPLPGQRPYADVDLLIHEEQAHLAAELAVSCGWRVKWTLADSLVPHHHEVLHLVSASGRTTLDVHRWALHALLPGTRRQRELTRQMWQAAVVHDWQGVPVHLPDPRDAVLLGLVLQRAWGDDSWAVKSHDWLDLTWLIRRYGLTPAQLHDRARELDVTRTLQAFLNLCSPFSWQLNLRPRSRLDFLRWSLHVTPERPTLLFEHTLFRWWEAGTTAQDVRQGHKELRVVQALLAGPPPPPFTSPELDVLLRRIPAAILSHTPARQDTQAPEVQRLTRGVRGAVRERYFSGPEREFWEALTLYAALTARGYRASYCASPPPHAPGGPQGTRYWVELGAQTLPPQTIPGQVQGQGVPAAPYRFPAPPPSAQASSPET